MDTPTDVRSLAHAARGGDRDALAGLIDRVRLRLFAVAYAVTGHYEDAQDAVAAAILRICQRTDGLRDPCHAPAWMAVIARNEARRVARARRAATPLDDAVAAPPGPDPVLRLDIQRALAALPADQGRAAALHYLAGVPIREISKRLGRPEGTVKYWLHEGRRRLAEQMEGYGPMHEPCHAVIVSDEPASGRVREWSGALEDAGWSVRRVISRADAARVRETGEAEGREIHVPAALVGCRLVAVEDPLGSRSAFELLTLLNATAERDQFLVCLFAEPPSDPDDRGTALAAWLLGVSVFLHKPFEPGELTRYARRLRGGLPDGP